jgi:Pyruvate/2-oxoglutarate dehydrogenase complex, dihydrolipoamide acyltransferase (E2) component, and related enzymes
MAKFELKLPKMGESVAEATLTNWLKEVGDTIEADEAVLEIATDKVDSEVPSEVDGVLLERLFEVDDVIQVGQTIAVIEVDGEAPQAEGAIAETPVKTEIEPVQEVEVKNEVTKMEIPSEIVSSGERFYSPLVRNIAGF